MTVMPPSAAPLRLAPFPDSGKCRAAAHAGRLSIAIYPVTVRVPHLGASSL